MKTVNADTTLVDSPTQSGPVTPHGTVASIINIPPQVATTVCWISVGVLIGWWLFRPQRKSVAG